MMGTLSSAHALRISKAQFVRHFGPTEQGPEINA